MSEAYQLQMRRQNLVIRDGFRVWETTETTETDRPEELAIILVDVWNQHWCAGANHRLTKLLPKMDATVRRARDRGVLIIHAPSDVVDFYADSPARKRALEIPAVDAIPEVNSDLPNYAPPIDAGDHGSDTPEDLAAPNTGVWHRQHEAIWIDESRDLISDKGTEVYANLKARGIKRVLFLGVHTNMCVMCRSFAIMALRRGGIETAIIRDLTDLMYNPASKPYVSHEDGLQLMLGYIEKFWCPSIDSAQL